MSIWDQQPELVARLTTLVKQGKSGTEISRTLKITKGMVAGKAARLGLKLHGDNANVRQGRRVAHVEQGNSVPLMGAAAPSAPRRFSWQDERMAAGGEGA